MKDTFRDYQWLRTLGGRYANVWDSTHDALVFSAAPLNLMMKNEQTHWLMQESLQLTAWPDVKPALDQLRARGIKLAILSNATNEILEAGIRDASEKTLSDLPAHLQITHH